LQCGELLAVRIKNHGSNVKPLAIEPQAPWFIPPIAHGRSSEVRGPTLRLPLASLPTGVRDCNAAASP
jgi:hypothetical protein